MKQPTKIFLEATVLLLTKHYTLLEAKSRAHLLCSQNKENLRHLILVAATMALEDKPWWDSKDPKTRALHQLNHETLLLPSIEALIKDIEDVLGRKVKGKTAKDKQDYLCYNVDYIISELKGEEPIDPLETLIARVENLKANTKG